MAHSGGAIRRYQSFLRPWRFPMSRCAMACGAVVAALALVSVWYLTGWKPPMMQTYSLSIGWKTKLQLINLFAEYVQCSILARL